MLHNPIDTLCEVYHCQPFTGGVQFRILKGCSRKIGLTHHRWDSKPRSQCNMPNALSAKYENETLCNSYISIFWTRAHFNGYLTADTAIKLLIKRVHVCCIIFIKNINQLSVSSWTIIFLISPQMKLQISLLTLPATKFNKHVSVVNNHCVTSITPWYVCIFPLFSVYLFVP